MTNKERDDLRALRIRLNLDTAHVAVRVGVSPQTVNNWESGRTTPKQADIDRWVKVMQRLERQAQKRREAS